MGKEDPFIVSGIATTATFDRDPLAPTMDTMDDDEEDIPVPNPSFEAIVSVIRRLTDYIYS